MGQRLPHSEAPQVRSYRGPRLARRDAHLSRNRLVGLRAPDSLVDFAMNRGRATPLQSAARTGAGCEPALFCFPRPLRGRSVAADPGSVGSPQPKEKPPVVDTQPGVLVDAAASRHPFSASIPSGVKHRRVSIGCQGRPPEMGRSIETRATLNPCDPDRAACFGT